MINKTISYYILNNIYFILMSLHNYYLGYYAIQYVTDLTLVYVFKIYKTRIYYYLSCYIIRFK